jgi:dUTP pyrophosphatase
MSFANEDEVLLYVKKLTEHAMMPQRGTEEAAGYDLTANETVVIKSGERSLVSTGIAITVPKNTYGRIAPRSGLAFKHGIDVLAGVIDRDYTGEVKVILLNTGTSDFQVDIGDRIAQLVIEVIMLPSILQVDNLPETTRSSLGFGSTGK